MASFFSKPYRWAGFFSAMLAIAFTCVLLDTFVIPKPQVQVKAIVPSVDNTASPDTIKKAPMATASSDPIVTNLSYEDSNIKIQIEIDREHDTTFYVADIQISDASHLKTALAENTFGRNINEKTSSMAKDNNAILAINGDYCGFRNTGFVLRNGVLYRDTGNNEALVIDVEGNFSLIDESSQNGSDLTNASVWQVLSFGPTLVSDGQIAVDMNEEISGKSMTSNPRTAIGQVGPLHYIMIVSDGRTSESNGLSLYQLAAQFSVRGCTIAYNLDGGGSSTMVFNGNVINKPTTNGNIKEREVSDIVYIGY